MTDPKRVAAEYIRIRDRLLESYPDLADAENRPVLDDTMEGLHAAPDIVGRLVAKARADEASVVAIKTIMDEHAERAKRLSNRAKACRAAAQEIMETIGVKKIERPEATITITNSPSRVVVTDQDALPDDCWRVSRAPDLTRIRKLLESGPIPGATLSNGAPYISIRKT